MIWAIGDVHGMFDPLKRIMTEISRVENETKDEVEKIVFIGDLIDHGPSSKEVLDLVRLPPHPVVALMGDHEEMAVRATGPRPGGFAGLWLENGGFETCVSLVDQPGGEFDALMSRIGLWSERRDRPNGRGGKGGRRRKDGDPKDGAHAEGAPEEAIPIPAKYRRFLRGLKRSHEETIVVRGRPVRFLFTHALPEPGGGAGPEPDASPDSVLARGRRYDYNGGYGGAVIVHGHVPTGDRESVRRPGRGPGDGRAASGAAPETVPAKLLEQFDYFDDSELAPFLFSRSPGASMREIGSPDRRLYEDDDSPLKAVAGPYNRGWWDQRVHHAYETRGDLGVEAVNVDTGAVSRGALTALGLSARYLDAGFLVYLSCPTGLGFRKPDLKVLRRSVRFDRLGGPEASRRTRPRPA